MAEDAANTRWYRASSWQRITTGIICPDCHSAASLYERSVEDREGGIMYEWNCLNCQKTTYKAKRHDRQNEKEL